MTPLISQRCGPGSEAGVRYDPRAEPTLEVEPAPSGSRLAFYECTNCGGVDEWDL